jgi:hypothetical protein
MKNKLNNVLENMDSFKITEDNLDSFYSENMPTKEDDKYFLQLIDLVGFLENDEYLKYGLTLEEYLHPTESVILKVEKYLLEHEDKEKFIKR